MQPNSSLSTNTANKLNIQLEDPKGGLSQRGISSFFLNSALPSAKAGFLFFMQHLQTLFLSQHHTTAVIKGEVKTKVPQFLLQTWYCSIPGIHTKFSPKKTLTTSPLIFKSLQYLPPQEHPLIAAAQTSQTCPLDNNTRRRIGM